MRNWNYTCEAGTQLRAAIYDGDLQNVINNLRNCINEILLHYTKEEVDSDLVERFDDLLCLMDGDDDAVADIDFCDDYFDDAGELVNSRLNEFYDLCDDYDIWVAM